MAVIVGVGVVAVLNSANAHHPPRRFQADRGDEECGERSDGRSAARSAGDYRDGRAFEGAQPLQAVEASQPFRWMVGNGRASDRR